MCKMRGPHSAREDVLLGRRRDDDGGGDLQDLQDARAQHTRAHIHGCVVAGARRCERLQLIQHRLNQSAGTRATRRFSRAGTAPTDAIMQVSRLLP